MQRVHVQGVVVPIGAIVTAATGVKKQSSNKNDGQNFLTSVAAVTAAPMGVTTP